MDVANRENSQFGRVNRQVQYYEINLKNSFLIIQVSYDIQNDKTRKREIAGLPLAARKTGCDRLLLLTDHEYSNITHNDYAIVIRPVYEYLCEDY